MTELEKCCAGLFYDAALPARLAQHREAERLCYAFNQTPPSALSRRTAILRRLFRRTGTRICVEPRLDCSYGVNLSVGEDFFANRNCLFMDDAPICFGRNVFLGPGCEFYTAHHPIHYALRNRGLERALPITVGDNVWFGGRCVVLPGVTIGSGTVIGAGSVVTRDLPDNVVAAGNPCRILRAVTEADLDEVRAAQRAFRKPRGPAT